MRCTHCNIEVDCKAKFCPLCHQPLEIDDSKREAYPEKKEQKTRRFIKRPSLPMLYLIIAVLFSAIGLTINLVTGIKVQWFWIIIVFFSYIYLLIKNTILSNNSLSIKAFIQAAMIFLILYMIGYYIKEYDPNINSYSWAIDYALPSVIILSIIVVDITAISLLKKDFALLTDPIIFSILSIIPIILFACHVTTKIYLDLACLLVGIVSIIICFIIGRERLIQEFKRKYHL